MDTEEGGGWKFIISVWGVHAGFGEIPQKCIGKKGVHLVRAPRKVKKLLHSKINSWFFWRYVCV